MRENTKAAFGGVGFAACIMFIVYAIIDLFIPC